MSHLSILRNKTLAMVQADSPESVPSVAAISQASSTDSDDIVRTLFSDEKPRPIQLRRVENIQKVQSKSMVPSSDVSVANSDATVVPSWNLSPKSSSEDIPGAKSEGEPTEKYQFFVDPPEDFPSSCNGLNLTPKQLAEIFLVFEGAGRLWPMRKTEKVEEVLQPKPPDAAAATPAIPQSKAEESKTMEWRRRAESLELECRALKRIARIDSTNIVKLKRTVETQRETSAHTDSELYKKQMVLGMLGHQLEALKKDLEIRREREADLLETNRILKGEVDQLTKSNEAETLKEEGKQLLEIQNEGSRGVITELRGVLELNEAENTSLRSEIQSLQNELNRRDHDKSKEVVYNENNTNQNPMKSDESLSSEDTPVLPTLRPDELMEVLRQISARLEAVERGQDREEEQIRDERRSREAEMEDIRLMVEESCKRRQEILQITQDSDEVEIVLPREEKVATRRIVTKDATVNTAETHLVPTTRDVAMPYSSNKYELSSWCCESWESL